MVIVRGGVINGSGFPMKNSFSLQKKKKVSSLLGHQPLFLLNKRLEGKIKSCLFVFQEKGFFITFLIRVSQPSGSNMAALSFQWHCCPMKILASGLFINDAVYSRAQYCECGLSANQRAETVHACNLIFWRIFIST